MARLTNREMYTPLLILCVLSLIGSLCGILYGMGLSSIATVSKADLANSLSMFGIEPSSEMIDQMTTLIELGPLFIVFSILEIIGVVMVMRGNYAGFHLYAASQIGLAGLMVVTSGWTGSMLYILWNALWVTTYWRAIKSAELHKQAKGAATSGRVTKGTDDGGSQMA